MDSSFFQEIRFLISDLFLTFERLFCYESFFSKYIYAFKKVLTDDTKQKYALFATPCHIYSVSKYIDLHKLSDKDLFVDIFCHGCPSLNLWKKYLEYC